MKETRRSLLTSVTALILCFVMLVGTTFAWFTDSATSANNIIKAGSLDISMEWSKDNANWNEAEGPTARPIFDYRNWEPGYTEVRYIKVQNLGSLAFKYQMAINPTGAIGKLAEVIDVSYDIVTNNASFVAPTAADKQGSLKKVSTLSELISGTSIVVGGVLLPDGETAANHYSGEIVICVTFHMQETAGNEYQGASIGDAFGINLYATQYDYENDSFDNSYDNGATWPSIPVVGNTATVPVNNNNGVLADAVTMTSADGKISATLPAGTKLEPGVTNATLSVSDVENSQANITLTENEAALSLDVHISGVAEDNDVPTIIYLAEALPVGLNMGNYSLYHVEDGNTNIMTYVADVAELDVHNEFAYDPATGNVTLCMESFSEVAMVAETENAWEGNFDYSWYDASKTELVIANADQLAAFGAIVGGMAEGIEQDSFDGKTVTLLSDINLGDKESENNPDIIFYPIGYNSSDGSYEKTGVAVSTGFYSFEGTFDGNGNAISNFYQNTWEMKGDHNWYAPEDQYYRDGMGLFGRIYNGTVKNLTVDSFSSDGEITTTGVIAAYADCGAKFENIAITNCNPRVYNIGNGGIVGCAGWYNKTESTEDNPVEPITFRNITVDQTNKISALWGSYDVSCGGILGQYYPTSGQSSANYPANTGVHFENCHVAAIMDVNNDVCANYQYYWYRYSGMLIGNIRATTKDADGYTIADTTGVTVVDCTYTLGDWNEYWYCELVKNTLASYTHDHQFSRLTKIADVSEIQDENGNWNREGNFVIPEADNSSATCYHIFRNSEGELYEHKHDSADDSNNYSPYESFDLNGDGELNDLKEDRTCYFMPFNQIFNGNGYGVKAHYEFEGIEEKTDGPVNSEVKFESLDTVTTYRPGQTITLGQLVDSIVDDTKLSKISIFAAVSPATESDSVSATYSLDLSNWENSTITFAADCEGSAKIVITDYFYCTPTIIYLDPEQAADKFTANSISEQNAYTQITLGTLFGVQSGATIGNVTATVTDPNGNETTITGTNSDWTTKTIDLTKDGTWTVAIKDDDAYCSVTTVTFIVNKVDKFTRLFNKDFLYRVGNENTVTLGTMFSEIETDVTLSSVNVSITNVAGNAAGAFTPNATWTSGTIQFTDTGVVKVTISADGANAVELNLEVVDAVNATTATSATSNNVVLLQDCGFSSLEVSGGYTLYGNGFTLTCGSDSYAKDRTYSFVELKNGTLDNVKIVVPNFSHAIMYEKNKSENNNDTDGDGRYKNIRSAVLVSATSKITNSYISGGRAAIYLTSGELTVKNSTIYGGAVANIQTEASSHLILEDVTLIQKPIKANVNDTSKTIMGLSVVTMCDTNGVGSPITLKGYLHQYAWANSDYSTYVPSDAQSVVDEVLDKTDFVHSITYDDGVTRDSVNLGFVYMPSGTTATNADNMNDERDSFESMPYENTTVKSIATIYTYNNAKETDASVQKEPSYTATTQGAVIPSVKYEETNENRVFTTTYDATEGKWKSTLKVDVDAGEYSFSFGKLLAQKYGKNLAYTVTTENGTAVNKNAAITLNSAVSNVYILTITDNQIYDKDGNITGETVETTYVFELLSTKTSLPAPTWTSETLNGTPYIVVDSKDGDWNCAVPVLDGLKVNYWSKKQNKEIELDLSTVVSAAGLSAGLQNGSNNTITITVADEYTLTITTTGFKTNDNGKPVVVGGKLYFTVSSSSNYVSTNTTDRTVSISYSFTDANNSDPISLSTSFNVVYSTYKGTQYKYSDFCNGTLTEATCITPDTLITLADGTQVRVDSLKGDELLLVWNMETGKLDYAPIMFVDSDPEAEYEIVHLYFSDGTDVKVISEHGFWDYDLNKYVYLDRNAADYIGHTFAKQNGDKLEKVTLTDVVIETELTTAWSPVTVGHLCYFVNGMLSMPGGVGGLFNIFEVDPETMTYDYEQLEKDIETYGLFTYEELNAICPLTEEMFNAAGGAYLKISIGKGNLTMDELINMINRYSKYI